MMGADAGEDREPDYRMSLAAERTYLAFLRTGLVFLAAGVAVAGALSHAGAAGLRRGFGAVLVVLGATIFTSARIRLVRVTSAMRRGEPLPVPQFGIAFTVVLMAVALALALAAAAAVILA